ncbi:unnamed protein product [Ixodes persulcatus]
MDSSWRIAILAAVMAFFGLSSNRSSGYFYTELMNEFNIDRGTASWPVCVLGTLTDTGGVFAGPLARRYSTLSVMICGAVLTSVGMLSSAFAPTITWFTITMGLLHGIGAGTLYTMLQIILSRSFEKYRATAHGIMYIGASLSALVGPQFLFFLLRSYNFRSSVLLYGAILLHTIPISFLFRSVPCANARNKMHITVFSICENNTMVETPKNTNESATEKVSIWKVVQPVLRLPIYYVVSLAWLVTCYNVEIFVATVLDYAVDKGASHSDAVFILSYISLADLFGRVLPLVADHQFVRRSTFTACNFFMMGASVTCMPLVTSYGAFVGVAVLVSCSTGCAMSICGVLLADYVCLDHLEVSYGLMGLLCAPLLLVKPFLIGYFRDRLGSYDDLYYILAGLIFSLCLLWGLVAFNERRTSKPNALKTNKDTVSK